MDSLIDLEFDLIEAESCGDTREANRLRVKIADIRERENLEQLIKEVTHT